MRLFALLLALIATPALASEPAQTIDYLQDISVTIIADNSQGSGVLFTRQDGDNTVSYVWTCGHVVDSLRTSRTVISNGVAKTKIEFYDAQIVKEFQQDGRRVGETKVEAEVIAYSHAEFGEDLALLRIRKRDFAPVKTSARFYEGDIPQPGTDLYHVGSLLGKFGANSLTKGSVSHIGRVLDLRPGGTVFDQVAVGAYPGSSGGGVFLQDGQYMGMLVRGAGEGFNFIVPIRRMREWAGTMNVAWAMDRDLPVTQPRSLDDEGIEYGPTQVLPSPVSAEFPYLIRINK